METRLPKFLRNYRATPHSTTAKSPAELFMEENYEQNFQDQSTPPAKSQRVKPKKEIKWGRRRKGNAKENETAKKMQIVEITQNQEK